MSDGPDCAHCSCPAAGHQHFRGGTECTSCDVCPAYRRPRLTLRAWWWLGRAFLADIVNR